MPPELHELSATELVGMVRRREVAAEAGVRSCMERIAAREPQVSAWAAYDVEYAIAQAKAVDRTDHLGALAGVPFGAKDVFDSADLPTAYNSEVYRGWRPAADASVIAIPRAAGSILMGKTVTTEFAYRKPGPTSHPLNPAHSPGGSSSGSAAAVADHMVPLALGTQTGGSTIRPAAYCGIVGCKPTLGLVSRVGLKFLSESMDTVGLMARSVADVQLFLQVLTGVAHEPTPDGPPRVGLCLTPRIAESSPEAQRMVERACTELGRLGASVTEPAMPSDFEDLWSLHTALTEFEFARSLAYETAFKGDLLSPQLRAAIDRGWQTTRPEWEHVVRRVVEMRKRVDQILRDVDFLVSLSAPAEAPTGLHDTGSSVFNRPWTLLGLPCVTIPWGSGPAGLPLGIQLIGPRAGDARLLAWARWCSESLPDDP